MITSHGVRIKCFTLLNVNKQIQARTAERFRNFVRAVHGDILARNRRLYRAHAESRLLRNGYKEKYESRIADLAVEMEQLEDGLRTMDTQIEQHRALEQDAAQIKTDRALTGALIERLIDRIEVSHDKQITVRYRFQSEFETYAEVLEQCRNM